MADQWSYDMYYFHRSSGQRVKHDHDYKSKILSYTFNSDIAPGKHVFKLTLVDNKNNFSEFSADFSR